MLVAGSVSFVSCSDDDDTNSSNSSSDANGSGSGSSSSGSSESGSGSSGSGSSESGSGSSGSGSSESGSGSSGSGSSGSTVSEATASVTELAYDSDTLNNKVFSYDDDDEIRYLTFTDGKCYKSDSSLTDLLNKEKDYLFISCNNKIYRSQKATRTSGSGLFATFDDGDECKYTLNSDGTGIINFTDGDSMSFTFTNNAGLITMSCTYEGETFTGAMYYNGEYLYNQKEELTFVKNYSAN